MQQRKGRLRAGGQFIQLHREFLVKGLPGQSNLPAGAKVARLGAALVFLPPFPELGSMTPFVLETARLRMRSFSPEDLDDLIRLCTDPQAMRYLPPNFRPETEEETVARLQRYLDHEAQHGCAFYHVSTHAGDFVGRAGYYWIPEIEMFELGYSLLPDDWGKGYATELTHGLIHHAFDELGWRILCGRTMPENAASRKVLEKTGFQYKGPRTFEMRFVPFELAYYELEAFDDRSRPANLT